MCLYVSNRVFRPPEFHGGAVNQHCDESIRCKYFALFFINNYLPLSLKDKKKNFIEMPKTRRGDSTFFKLKLTGLFLAFQNNYCLSVDSKL